MPQWKHAVRVFGVVTTAATAAVVYGANPNQPDMWNNMKNVYASWSLQYTPTISWNYNWDKRDPASLTRPPKDKTDPQKYEEELKKNHPSAVRHLFLVRHGQYDTRPDDDQSNVLTELGKEQAFITGTRLKELNIPFTKIISSTMKRADQTAKIVHQLFPGLPLNYSDLLREGMPIRPEPPLSSWRPEWKFLADGPRIEAAFQEYFHRASVDQKEDSFEIIVCHANVIRYFVCRALQFPPEGWLRMRLYHASITWITIKPDGKVSLKLVGDAGHIPADKLSYHCLTSTVI
ncbi:serine/threonine-protein phosphatase PGAM5, mitochondrial-like [Argonauta hians]